MIDGRARRAARRRTRARHGARRDAERGSRRERRANGANDGDGGDSESAERGEGADERARGRRRRWLRRESARAAAGADVGDKSHERCARATAVRARDESDDAVEAREAIERETDEKRAGRDERRVVCMEENEVKQALALLKGALKKHPGAFALGAGTSAVRVFANVFALSAVSDASAEFHEQVHSVLYALMSVASKSDLVGMHELCKGCVELASDSKRVLELFPGKRYGGEFGAADDDFEDEASRETIVLCCFDTALAHVKRSEETSGRNGEAGTNGLSSSTSTGLMIEVQSLVCAMNVTNTACKLLECALLTNPQNVAPLTTSESVSYTHLTLPTKA